MTWQRQAANITYTFVDDDQAVSTHTIVLADPAFLGAVSFPTSLPLIHTFAQDYADLITTVSDCALTKYSITIETYDDTYPQAATGSDVEDKGVVVFRCANNQTMRMSWPGIKESTLVSNITRPGTYIDLTNADVAALAAVWVTGQVVGATTVAPSDRRGADIIGIKDAFKQNTASLASMGHKG